MHFGPVHLSGTGPLASIRCCGLLGAYLFLQHTDSQRITQKSSVFPILSKGLELGTKDGVGSLCCLHYVVYYPLWLLRLEFCISSARGVENSRDGNTNIAYWACTET